MTPSLTKVFAEAQNLRQVLIDNMLVESHGTTRMEVLDEYKNDSTSTNADTGTGSSAPTAKLLVVEGKVGQCGVATANKRLYERKIMEREIDRLQDRIAKRSLLSAVDHPADGKSRIREAGAICVGLRVENDGSIIGKYEIVEDSTGGKDLAAFIRAGASVGMSSRGMGSTRMDEQGNHVVGEDFRLHGFDFVADPACRDAYPTLVAESLSDTTTTENEIRVRYPNLIENIEARARQAALETVSQEVSEANNDQAKLELIGELRETLREDFAVNLIDALQNQRAQLEQVVRSELLSDPKVAGARKFVEDLAEKLMPYKPAADVKNLLSSRDEEIDQLKTKLDELNSEIAALSEQKVQTEQQARSLGYRLFVERSLSGHENADRIRELIGDVSKFRNAEELRSHIASAIDTVNDSIKRAKEEADERADNEIKIKEHKALLAAKKAELATSQLESVRTEFTEKLEKLSQKFSAQIDEKNLVLSEALDTIKTLEQKNAKLAAEAREAELTAYAVKRTVGHPRRDEIMAAVTSGKADTKQRVAELAEQWDQKADEPGGVAERIRRSLGRGREAPSEAERGKSVIEEDTRNIPGLELCGTTLGELRALSGISSENKQRRF